jgi:hypothetical protein
MYDDLALLFGLPSNDKRIKLFLHVFLHTTIMPTTGRSIVDRLLNFDTAYWEEKPELFDTRTTSGLYVPAASAVDIEWYTFATTLANSLANINNKKPFSIERNKRLAILNKYTNVSKLQRFFILDPVKKIFGIRWDSNQFVKSHEPETDEGKIYEHLMRLLNLDPDVILHVIRNPNNNNALKKYRNSIVFSYKIDKISIQLMLEDAKNAPTPLGTPSTFLANLDSNITDTYFRDSKDPSKLLTKDSSGNLIEVQRGSKAFYDAANDPNNCIGLGVKGKHAGKTSVGNTCTDYLLQCIDGADPTSCRNYMTDKEFWGDNNNSIKQEVTKMLPAMALTTLEKFGFKQITVNDSIAKRNINKVEPVNSWLQKLEKDMNDPMQFSNIENNTNLILYLTLLVDKINGSPQILNKNIVESEDTSIYNPKRFVGQLLYNIGLLPKVSIIPNYAANVNRINDTFRYGLNIAAGYPIYLIKQRGGASGMVVEPYRYVSIGLENQYNTLKNVLKTHGKTLDESNDNEVKALFANFRNTENKVVQTMKIMEKYIELMDVFAYNDPHQILNLETLNEITKSYEHQLNKTNRKQDTLVQALQTLADIVQEAVNKSIAAKQNNNNAAKQNNNYTSTPFSHDN